MKLHVRPAPMRGRLQVPPSKSYLLRAAALTLLAPGVSVIHNVGVSDDEKVAINLLSSLGAHLKRDGRNLHVQTKGIYPKKHTLQCGESALALRLFTCIAALLPFPTQLCASGSLKKRPQDLFADFFPTLGVTYASNAGHVPLFVQGPLRPANLTVDGSLSSQFCTGLLIAYAAAGAQNVSITLQNPTSTPYLAMTTALLGHFGCPVIHNGYQHFHFEKRQVLRPAHVHVPGDWSSAAYLLVAGTLSGTLTLSGLARDDLQADKAILPIMEQAQCQIVYKHALSGNISAIELLPTPVIAPFTCDLTHSPDIFPALAALAAFARGTSYLSGLHRLVHKESNRAVAVENLLTEVGVRCEKKGDTLCIEGRSRITGNITVSGQNDHRIIMLAALLALRSETGICIKGTEGISKSFPSFFNCLKHVGIPVETVEPD